MLRILPRRVRDVRVERSKRCHFRQTKAAALRLRTLEMAAIMLERITSGRSLMAAVVGLIAMEKGKGEIVDLAVMMTMIDEEKVRIF